MKTKEIPIEDIIANLVNSTRLSDKEKINILADEMKKLDEAYKQRIIDDYKEASAIIGFLQRGEY